MIEWLIATTFVFFQFFLQSSSSLMSESWIREFNLNTVQVSNLSAAFFYTYVLMQIPVGILFDKYSVKKILIFASVILSLGCLMLSITKNYEIAILARFLMGIGASFGYIGMLKVVLNNFKPNQFALMLGAGEAIAMSVVTLGIIMLAYFLKLHSWRIAMLFCGIFALCLTFAIIFYIKDTKKASIGIGFIATLHQVKQLMLNKQVILCSIYGFFVFSIINAFTSLWGISFITNTTNYSPEIAANMVSVVFIGLGIGAPVTGLVSKRFNNHLGIMKFSAISIFITTFILIFIPNIPPSIMVMILFLSGGFCAGYVQCMAIIKDSVKFDIQATALATANMIIMAGAPILQVLIGILLHSHLFHLSNSVNYRLSLAVIPIGMFIAIVLCRYYIKQPQQSR